MASFWPLMARERAAEQGVEAETICLRGEFRPALKKAAQEEGVSLIVLGRPGGEESVFDVAALSNLAAEIEKETGIQAKII